MHYSTILVITNVIIVNYLLITLTANNIVAIAMSHLLQLMENGFDVSLVFFDMRKAFDSVPTHGTHMRCP